MMHWETKLAERTRWFRRNTVREFLKYAGQPGIISFAGGLPDSALLPVDQARAATDRVLARIGAKALQYGPSEGIPELREYVASRFASAGINAENVLITTGSQQALDLVGRVFLDRGDCLVAQNPTYLAALSAWSPYGVRFVSLDDWLRAPHDAKMIYVIPNFQNPTGETVPQFLRQQVLSASGGLPLLEDDAYGELRYDGEPQPSFLELGAGRVLHLGTLSKVLAPGLRLGWIIAPREVLPPLIQAKQSIDLHTSTYAQYLALEMIHSGVLEQLIPKARAVYRGKRDLMLQTLERTMPSGVRWSRPEGGLFLFLKLPPGIHGREVARRALEAGVLVVPGEEFHIKGGEETLRLNFSHPANDDIVAGVERLAQIVAQAKTNDPTPEIVQNT